MKYTLMPLKISNDMVALHMMPADESLEDLTNFIQYDAASNFEKYKEMFESALNRPGWYERETGLFYYVEIEKNKTTLYSTLNIYTPVCEYDTKDLYDTILKWEKDCEAFQEYVSKFTQ